MPGSGNLDVREWRRRLQEKQPMQDTTPLQIADRLRGLALETERLVEALRPHAAGSAELAATLDDFTSFACSPLLRGEDPCGLRAGALRLGGRPADQAAAVRHLESALQYWTRYAAVRDAATCRRCTTASATSISPRSPVRSPRTSTWRASGSPAP